MDVSEKKEVGTLGGQDLLHTVASLTGLPEPLVHQELDHILAAGQQDSASLTLDGLRAAMLAYLESIQAEMIDSDTEEALN